MQVTAHLGTENFARAEVGDQSEAVRDHVEGDYAVGDGSDWQAKPEGAACDLVEYLCTENLLADEDP